jgi:hypothetical protein
MTRRDKRVVILMSEEEWEEVRKRAGIASVGAYIREVLGNGENRGTDNSDVRRVPDVSIAVRGAGIAGGSVGTSKDAGSGQGAEEPVVQSRGVKGAAGKSKAACDAVVGPGMYCSKCDRRH